ncbi:MAG: HDOD domain-containing protein [Candidatus Rokubacteria bacterium]|nr:HDOD domain-containing protein [Candidatus Rokubacteria bacterium]
MTLSWNPAAATPERLSTPFKERFLADLDLLPPLPSFPPVISRLMKIVNDYDSSVLDIAWILREDPGLTVRVLRMANSPVYGARMPVTSVAQAVLRLGMVQIRNIILTLGIIRTLETWGGRDRKAFWLHSVTVAFATEAILQVAVPAAEEDGEDGAFAAGLLHDIGLLVLWEYYPSVFVEISRLASEQGLARYKAELAALETDHGRIGALIAARWGLPQPIVSGIDFHHQPALAPAEDRRVADLVHLAECICSREGIGDAGDGLPMDPDPETLRNLGVEPALFPEIISRTQELAKKSALLIELAR